MSMDKNMKIYPPTKQGSKEMFDEFYQTQKLKEIRKNTPLIKLVGLIKNVLEPEEIEIIIRNLKHE